MKNKMTKQEFYKKLDEKINESPELRKGQAAFNLMYAVNKEATIKTLDTEFDCFYHDEKVDLFIDKCLADVPS